MKTKTIGLFVVGLLVFAVGTQSVAAETTQMTGSDSWCSPALNGNGNTVACNFGLTSEQLKQTIEAAVRGATGPLIHQIVEISKTLGVTEDAAKTLLKIVGEDPSIPDDKLAEVLTKVANDYKRLQAQVAALNLGNPTAKAFVEKAKPEIDAGHFTRALELLSQATQAQIAASQEARKLREQAQAAEDAQMLGAASSIAAEGAIYRTLRQYDEAGKLYRQAIEIEERIPGPTPRAAARYNNLGELYLGWGKFQDAETMLNRSIEMHEKSGQDNINLVVPLSNLGQLYWATYRYPEAEAAYKRALAIGEKVLPTNDPSLVRTRLNYAQLLDRLGRGAEADKLRE